MISYICPSCNYDNKLDHAFHVTNYICRSCSKIVRTATNEAIKTINKPTENVALDVGGKGTLEGIEYVVVAIVVKKYGNSVTWREYYLKDKLGNDVFLSESDGHWVLLFPKDVPLNDFTWYAEFEGKKYRWYETTPCSVHAAAGFFEDRLELKLYNYKEFVNGAEMISYEEVGGKKQFFWGKHVPKGKIKRAFKPSYMPNYYGIGIVQPFYFNLRQFTNILGISAVLMCLLFLYHAVTQTNQKVFDEKISFVEVHNKELISKSFELKGASAPLEVKLFSNVENSWANAEISLVNEGNNETTYTSQDVEKYSGVSGGERWSEGSRNKDFNFCGVAPGKYHFQISAVKQGMERISLHTFYSEDGKMAFTETNDGWIDVRNLTTGELTAINLTNLGLNNPDLEKQYQEAKKLTDSMVGNNVSIADPDPANPDIQIQAYWKPVTFWNIGILLVIMIVLIVMAYWGKSLFNNSKWSNSSNSPYSSNN